MKSLMLLLWSPLGLPHYPVVLNSLRTEFIGLLWFSDAYNNVEFDLGLKVILRLKETSSLSFQKDLWMKIILNC